MTNLHPTIAAFLMPHIERREMPLTYQARCGRRRRYESEADALAYEAGWDCYPGGPIPPIGTPGSTGYFDAEVAWFDRQVERLDRVIAAEERAL